MSKRLQVLVSEEEMGKYKRVASQKQLSVGEWVRATLNETARQQVAKPTEEILAMLEWATKLNYPTADIDQMNREIEEGYLSDLP